MPSTAHKRFHVTMLVLCVLLGTIIACWTTYIQSQFLQTIGVNFLGALTIEPLLIVTSFLLGIKITKIHKIITAIFLVLLLGVSMLTITSMYTKHAYVALDTTKSNQQLVASSAETQKTINETLKSLNERSVTAKSALQVIEKLQEQQKATAALQQSGMLEIHAIVDTVASILHVENKVAILIFALFVSLAAVFAPSFLFFTAGMMLTSVGIFVTTNEVKEESKPERDPNKPRRGRPPKNTKRPRGRPKGSKKKKPITETVLEVPPEIKMPEIPPGSKVIRVV
jgi:hypothetical protein